MATEDKGPNTKTSLEERIKSNVALWSLGAVATGFTAGIAAVKWSDERYKVEPIPIAKKDTLVKAQSELGALQRAYNDLEHKNAELKEALSKQHAALESSRTAIAGQSVPAACISQRSELECQAKATLRCAIKRRKISVPLG